MNLKKMISLALATLLLLSSLAACGGDTAQPTDPIETKPAPTEPVPTEPVPTEPAPTEPAPSEPKPTEPKPTEPVCQHQWQEATCKAPKTCKRQGCEATEGEKLDHEWGDWELVQGPNGFVKERHCKNCDEA